tara:strand:+ start:1380 stop:1748 length:369 start_codon:yes stop_codon:yes gene_type:complete
MRTSLKYDFCEIEIYDNYLVSVMFEGINLTPDKNAILLNIATKYFKNTNFGYITNRLQSYSVDPSIYIETSKIENLVSFAIVSSKKINISNTEIEKLFYKKPFKHFTSLKDAIEWTNNIILK